jgi:hypothetical protein
MSKIILPQKQQLNETEDISLPVIKCSFCGGLTSTGMHQTRLEMIKKGETKIIDGKKMYKPPVMKRIDYYMCPDCIKKNTPWPGQRP